MATHKQSVFVAILLFYSAAYAPPIRRVRAGRISDEERIAHYIAEQEEAMKREHPYDWLLLQHTKEGNREGVRQAVKQGGAVSSKDNLHPNLNALRLASEQGNAGIVKELVQVPLGAQISGPMGSSPLHVACLRRHHNVVRVLVSSQNYLRYNNINSPDGGGTTALMHAASNGDTETATLLLKAGAEPDVKDKQEWTPFIWALFSDQFTAAQCLVKHKARIPETLPPDFDQHQDAEKFKNRLVIWKNFLKTAEGLPVASSS